MVRILNVAAHKVAVDTVGAGDVFGNAFLYGITHSTGYFEAGSSVLTASKVVSKFGPRLNGQN